MQEFFDGRAQLFRSELAAFSWNLLMFMVVTSCDANTPDGNANTHGPPDFPSNQEGLRADPQCFDAEKPHEPGRCSYATPQLCKNVQTFLALAPGAPTSIPVEVQIAAGSGVAAINPLSAGVTPVVIAGSETLDVDDIDRTTLAFGPAGAAPAHRSGGHRMRRKRGGFPSLLSHYRTREAEIPLGATEACVTGELFDGTPFEGCGAIRTIPACGIGFELVLVLPPLIALRRRRRRHA